MTEARSTLLWVRRPPYSTVHLAEVIRLAAMGTAMGDTYRVLFIAEGVRALVRPQAALRLGPPIEQTLAGIVTDERPALVHERSLVRRRLDRDSLVDRLPFRTIDDAEAARTIVGADRVVPF